MCVNSSSTTALLATHLPPNLLPWWVWLCLLLGMQQVVLELHACTVCSHDNARNNTLFYFIFYRSPIIACVVMHNTSTFIMSLSQIQHCVHITSVGSLGCVDFLLSILRHVLFSYHTPHHVSIVTASSPPPPPPRAHRCSLLHYHPGKSYNQLIDHPPEHAVPGHQQSRSPYHCLVEPQRTGLGGEWWVSSAGTPLWKRQWSVHLRGNQCCWH